MRFFSAFRALIPGTEFIFSVLEGIVAGVLFLQEAFLRAQDPPETPDTAFQVSGILVDSFSGEVLAYGWCLNKTRQLGTISSEHGVFTIPAYGGDTLVFSYLGYQTRYWVVPDTWRKELLPTYFVVIRLMPDTFELPLVRVYPWKTPEEFRQAFLQWTPPITSVQWVLVHLSREELERLIEETPPAPGTIHAQLEQQRLITYYAYRQYPYIGALNPLAWARWFQWVRQQSRTQKKNPRRSR